MSRTAVLVVTNEQDVGADFLVRELGHRGVRAIRLNTERSPEWKLTLRPTDGWRVSRGQRSLSSEHCAGVWWRRPEVPAAPVGTAAAAAEAIGDQWRAFTAALATVPGPTWVSEPGRIRAAEDKALQLRRAGEVGLPVPDSVWTNDADEAQAFVERWNGTGVVKSVASAWWEEAGEGRFVYAQLVGIDNLPPAGRLANAPVCFQQPLLPKRDIRVTVVQDVVLAAVREDQADEAAEPLDWRRAPQRAWLPYELPADIAECCRTLVQAFGLRFSGIDLALDNEKRHWFLEMNPNGEWGWLQRAGLPIAEALAETLLSQAR